MTLARSQRSRRLIAVISSFSIVAGLGAAVTISQSMATPFEPAPRHQLGPNLIENSGFGNRLNGWSVSVQGGAAVVTPGYDGSRRAAVLAPPRYGAVVLRDRLTDAPTLEAGGVYQATIWVRATGQPVNGNFRLLEWHGGAVAHATQATFRAVRSHWKRVGINSTATTDAGRLQLAIQGLGLAKTKGLLIDRTHLHRVKGADSTSTPSPDPTSPTPSSSTSTSATPTPTPTNTESPTPTPSGTSTAGKYNTRFGASIYEDGMSWTDAVAQAHKAYGGMEVVRVFNPGLPQPWSGRPGQTGSPIVVSFKGEPDKVIAGDYDSTYLNWFKTAPTDRPTWWTYYHEPEDDVEQGQFSSAAWRNAYHHIADLANSVNNPRLKNTVILMCWTLNPRSHRDFNNYYPGSDVVEALAFDCYNPTQNTSSYITPGSLFGPAAAKAKELGVQFGIAEVGSVRVQGDANGAKRAQWLRDIASWAISQHAAFVSYWDAKAGTNDYRLIDEPSRSAWYDVVNNY